jgi:hypothetical protein
MEEGTQLLHNSRLSIICIVDYLQNFKNWLGTDQNFLYVLKCCPLHMLQ